MTLIVLGVDALDPVLVDRFGVDGLTFDRQVEMETFAHSKEYPYTPEVWATIATGLSPSEHGIVDGGTSEWDNPLLEAASTVTGYLPVTVRGTLGDIVRKGTGAEYSIGITDEESFFDGDGRAVHSWPGAAGAENVRDMWDLLTPDDGKDVDEFERAVFGTGVQRAAWANEMLSLGTVELVATQIHSLDILGHMYASDEERLSRAYARVCGWISQIRSSLGEEDELLVVSDHGMQTEFVDGDTEPAYHSFRAFAGTTSSRNPPESVYGVRKWIESELENHQSSDSMTETSVPEEQLRDLGYIS